MKPFTTLDMTLGEGLNILGIVSIVALIIFYVHFQARNIIQGPALTLTDTFSSVQHERLITLHGTARNAVQLTLNGKEIHTDEHGTFTHMLVLENNYSIMSLDARDRFGRTASLTKEFVYVPS